MVLRRIVTGHDEIGKSIVVCDGSIPRFRRRETVPGASTSLAWSTEPGAPIPRDGADPTGEVTTFVPQAGGTRFIVLTLPPDEVYASPGFDAAAAAAERKESSPGLAELFEPDNPGMHTTPTVDYVIVLSGEIWLELDDGHLTRLEAGDIVVQNGTRHAWRNKSDGITTIAFVLIGAPDPDHSA
jgi:hypothetical protein